MSLGRILTDGQMLDRLIAYVDEHILFTELIRNNRLDYMPTKQGNALLVYWYKDNTVVSIDSSGVVRHDSDTRMVTDCLD